MATTLSVIAARARIHLQDTTTLATPSTPTITPQGAAGATTYTYVIVAFSQDGTSAGSAAVSTATGNATLSSSNFNRITWTTVTGAQAYRLYRTVGGATT